MNKKILYSFDIFDTLITRNCINPSGIFLLMEHILKTQSIYSNLPYILKENFGVIRKEIEIYTKENERILNNKNEVNFDDIYRVMQNNYCLDDEQINLLKKLEIETEQKNLVGILFNIDKVKKHIQNDEMCILISDMYYSEDILRHFLVNIDTDFKNIKIYTSSDYNKTKRGGLYKLIRYDFPDIKKWIHTGDNFVADVCAATKNNITPVYYKNKTLLKHEKYILEKAKDNYKFELIIGCSKNLRMLNSNTKYQFGCSFAGPLLYNYTKWVLQQCLSIGIKNIYFVSRDGFILKKLADILISENNLDIKSKYFYSSRIATRIITHNNYENFVSFIFNERCTSNNVNSILNYLNITAEELNSYIPKESIKQINVLNQELLRNKQLRTLIIKKNKVKIDLFKEYLEQEIPKDYDKVAFVDVNGSGRTQDITAEILNMLFPCKVYNFYINLIPTVQQKACSIKCAYNPSSNFQDGWIEILCRCLEGQTLGYKKQKDKIVPVKEFECNKHMIKWGFEDYLQGILDYTYSMNNIENENKVDVNSINLYFYMFEFIKHRMDKNTADMLGSVPFVDYGSEKFVKECAPKLNLLSIFRPKHMDYISIARCSFITKPFWKIIKFITSPETYGYISKDKKRAYLKIFKFKIDIAHLIWSSKR